ncbi:MAG TPA: MtrAB system histidine kinase MtrB [Microbacteriaceae bacterium]
MTQNGRGRASAGSRGRQAWNALRQWRGWREPVTTVARLWRGSLQFRTSFITVVLAGVAILVTGLVVSYSVGNDLFQSRMDQAFRDSGRARTSAQATLDAADATDPAAVQDLWASARSGIQTATSTRLVAAFREPGQASDPFAPTDFATTGLPSKLITSELRKQVQKASGRLYAQSVALPNAGDTTDPGIVVGTEIVLPSAGRYELYIGYDLSDSEQTLLFVQRTLLLAGLALILLIGAVTWVVVRFVVAPIRLAAETSQRLAGGDLEVRIPERGEDVLATLARSFNGMADSLQRQITQLANLSQLQQRFVSDVSHELRTPLTTIRLAGDVIYDQREAFPPATARTAELLHTQVERFDRLLSDLLEISRYDAGSVALELEPTNLVRLVEEATDSMKTLVANGGSELRVDAPGGYFDVEIDARRIRRIVWNLLGNAIEHGEGKPIVLTVDSNATAVAISVRDYGLGMTEHDLSRVFDRFWRADPSRRRTIGGTGLGLAISLEDATVHGGVIEVWSRPGAGSCFRLTLPRVPGSPIEASPLPLPPLDAPLDAQSDAGVTA